MKLCIRGQLICLFVWCVCPMRSQKVFWGGGSREEKNSKIINFLSSSNIIYYPVSSFAHFPEIEFFISVLQDVNMSIHCRVVQNSHALKDKTLYFKTEYNILFHTSRSTAVMYLNFEYKNWNISSGPCCAQIISNWMKN